MLQYIIPISVYPILCVHEKDFKWNISLDEWLKIAVLFSSKTPRCKGPNLKTSISSQFSLAWPKQKYAQFEPMLNR